MMRTRKLLTDLGYELKKGDLKMDDYMLDYIKKVLGELRWDLDRGKIIRFKTRKGLNMIRNSKRVEVIFMIREIEL